MLGIQPGQMIDEYRIISKIGKGGMASVYKAYQASMDRYVAIKVLSLQLIDNEEFLGRFKQEARLIARLEHPHILPIYSYGEDHGIPYLVTRYLNAGTLKDYLELKAPPFENQPQAPVNDVAVQAASPPLTLKQIDAIFLQVCDALDYAHEYGVIHRDIKPSNIMLDHRGAVFITDFGIAKLIESAIGNKETIPQFTATGAITGTPDYMSPEQAQGLRLDPRSDIYSLGIVLYEMLTGRVPFEADTPIAVIMKHISAPLPPPSTINPGIHPALEEVVVKALEKSPGARFSNMQEFSLAWKKALAVAVPPFEASDLEILRMGEVLSGGTPTPPFILTPEDHTEPPQTSEPTPPDKSDLLAVEDDSLSPHESNSVEEPPPSLVTPPVNNPPAKPALLAEASDGRPSPSTLDEDNKFLLKNLQLAKTASSQTDHLSNSSRTSQAFLAEQRNKRILWIAGGVALGILVILGLAAALRIFDFISNARHLPLGETLQFYI